MAIIKHDFGLKKRRSLGRFRKLLKLDALHEANVRANPLPYLERASERIYRLEKALFEAAQAAKAPFDEAPSQETIEVRKVEYQRLLDCRSIVEKALIDLTPGDDENL
jgi:hypothetical protein